MILGLRGQTRWRRWHFVLGGTVVALAVLVTVLVAVWDWDWFRPLIAREASAALGRKVTLQHFGLRLGRQTVAVADGVQIANPEGFAQDPPLATAERLTVTIDTMELLRHRAVVVPDILIEQPRIAATQAEDGSANYLFPALSSAGNGPGAKLGNLRITGGQAHVVLARLRADFNVAMETHETNDTPQIVAQAKGTYAGQPINADFVGGALLSLRDAATPYPVDLKVANGPTRATLVGSVQDPLNFAGRGPEAGAGRHQHGTAVAADRHRLSENPVVPDQRRSGLCRWQDPLSQLHRPARVERRAGEYRGRSRAETPSGDRRCHVPPGRSRRSRRLPRLRTRADEHAEPDAGAAPGRGAGRGQSAVAADHQDQPAEAAGGRRAPEISRGEDPGPQYAIRQLRRRHGHRRWPHSPAPRQHRRRPGTYRRHGRDRAAELASNSAPRPISPCSGSILGAC